jgi:hypothetical protein
MSTNICDNCGAAYGDEDVFCEQCGYDFLTGSLPDADAAEADGTDNAAAEADGADAQGTDVAAGTGDTDANDETAFETEADGDAEAGTGPGPDTRSVPPVLAPERDGDVEAELPAIVLEIGPDRDYFDDVVSDGEVDFPDPEPATQRLELVGHELHIGRASESRAIHPDIDLAELTGDQAVSSRHAVIRVDGDGNATFVDVGSTNGTLVGDLDSDPLVEGIPVVFEVGQTAYLGAWTKLVRRA